MRSVISFFCQYQKNLNLQVKLDREDLYSKYSGRLQIALVIKSIYPDYRKISEAEQTVKK